MIPASAIAFRRAWRGMAVEREELALGGSAAGGHAPCRKCANGFRMWFDEGGVVMAKAKRHVAVLMGLAVAVAVSYGAGRLVRMAGAAPGAAWAQEGGGGVVLTATVERVLAGDREAGIVKINGVEVVAINSTAGGLTGYERALILAKRLNDVFAAGVSPDDFRADVVQGMNVVLCGDKVLVTADQDEADLLGIQRAELAEQWAAGIRTGVRQALGLPEPGATEGATQPAEAGQEQPAGAGQEQPAEAGTEQPAEQGETAQTQAAAEEDWTPPEPYGQKNVPILSVGEGIRVGMAQVKGPKSRVEQVKAVALLETNFKRALEIDIYVPISTSVPGKTLARVQGVGVVGVAMFQVTGSS